MQNKLRQLIISALKRNEFTTMLSLDLSVQGYKVTVSGEVENDALIYEVIATVESVSPNLRVQSRLKVAAPQHAGVL
jgi:hypothetical protein